MEAQTEQVETITAGMILAQCDQLCDQIRTALSKYDLIRRTGDCGAILGEMLLAVEIWRGEVHEDCRRPSPLQRAEAPLLECSSGSFEPVIQHICDVEQELEREPDATSISEAAEACAENIDLMRKTINGLKRNILSPSREEVRESVAARKNVPEPGKMEQRGEGEEKEAGDTRL
ncbi:hypothetical protein LTR37_004634 [Vermiconidia calcicola]|uniref:Uncharacterized protein n=1 Tax=Vermiconidia calcicola TaxID=1690605 RepID=A0ACC3NLI9_9PEZI|nr:hypothetical protein LTR37_004634 [Vermiconidia calcicola]